MKRLLYVSIVFILLANVYNGQIFDKNLHESVRYLSHQFTTQRFNEMKDTLTEIDYIDSLYFFTLRYFEGDISETLLALTFTTLPFNKIPFKIPFVSIKLDLHLISACDSVFKRKNELLPTHFFIDSPKSKFGDKDKLAHFFGNAFLSYSITIFNLSKFMSIFVENFEDSFTTVGVYDNRDIMVNSLGESFGKLLRDNEKAAPSVIINLYNQIKLMNNL